MEDAPGPSSETSDWASNVKLEEDDPLAITFPTVKTEPEVNCMFICHMHNYLLSGLCLSVCLHMKDLLSGEFSVIPKIS
jgi:hypothetical protein